MPSAYGVPLNPNSRVSVDKSPRLKPILFELTDSAG
jgi:hypothetical protein